MISFLMLLGLVITRQKVNLVAALVLLLAASIIPAYQTQVATAQSTLNVSIVSGASDLGDSAYSPNPVVVGQGNVVRWTNNDTEPHTVTHGSGSTGPVSGGFDSGPIAPGESYSFAFYQPGEFDYYDKLNPDAVGKVIVTEPNTLVTYIYAYIDRQAYDFGDTVTVRGNVPDPDLDNPVAFTATDSRGRTISSQQRSIQADGSFNYEFNIPSSSGGNSPGEWSMSVEYENLKSTIPFRVNPSNMPISIVSIDVVDMLGNRISELRAGEQSVLALSVTNTASTAQNVIIVLQVVSDEDESTEHLSWLSTELDGDQSVQVGFGWVPGSAGSYTVQRFVWEDFENPVALSELSTSTIVVGQ